VNRSKTYSQLIKEKAAALGFSFCGIAKAGFLKDEALRLERWLKLGRQGEMSYLENWYDKRLDPTKLMPGTKSVISLLYNYYTDDKPTEPAAPHISKYAYGENYHSILKEKLQELLGFINSEIGETEGRGFVDSAPIMERAWAVKAGLGWIGKNCLLINPEHGSFFFLAELLLDLELEYDQPTSGSCGDCTLCMEVCPTGAIVEPYIVDARKCISYLTVEYKKEIPQVLADKFHNSIFGCDICQEVCPYNNKAIRHAGPRFQPRPEILSMTRDDWRNLTEESFKDLFVNSVVKRTKFAGLKRNIAAINSKKV